MAGKEVEPKNCEWNDWNEQSEWASELAKSKTRICKWILSTLCHTMHVRKAWQFPCCCLFCCPPISFFPFFFYFFLSNFFFRSLFCVFSSSFSLCVLFVRFFKYILNSYCSHSCSTSKCARLTFSTVLHWCYYCWRSRVLSMCVCVPISHFEKKQNPKSIFSSPFFALSVYHFDFTFIFIGQQCISPCNTYISYGNRFSTKNFTWYCINSYGRFEFRTLGFYLYQVNTSIHSMLLLLLLSINVCV